MTGTRKGFFGLRYPDLTSIFLDRFGIEFQVSGVVFQGKNNKTILVAVPGCDIPEEMDHVSPDVSEWLDLLKATDDPSYFEMEPNGQIVKAIHRKCQRSIGQEVQWRIYRRAGFKCGFCGNERPLTIDHKIPVEAGGTDEESNLEACCRPCNKEKANMSWEAWVEIMKRRGWR